MIIGGWPVQFLGPGNPLLHEAMEQAEEFNVEGVPVRVFSATHLAAIALQTGRAEDKARLIQCIEQRVVDRVVLEEIMDRHQLLRSWTAFKESFLGEKI